MNIITITKQELQRKIDNISLLPYCNYIHYTLKSDTLLYCQVDNSLFFVDNYNGFSYGLYITDNLHLLSEFFIHIKQNIDKIVVKNIYKLEDNVKIINLLAQAEFNKTSSYSGYKVKLNYDGNSYLKPIYATENDLEFIYETISKNFNVVADAILTKHDLLQKIKDHQILYLGNETAFVLCSVIKNIGYNSFLYSNGYSDCLESIMQMPHSFYHEKHVKFLMFWINDINKTAFKINKFFYNIKKPKQKFSIYE